MESTSINNTYDKTIKSFEAISKFKTYSKTNQILEKKFKTNSLKSFIITLKTPKIFIKPKFLEEFVKRHPYEKEQFLKENELKKNKNAVLEEVDSLSDTEKRKKNKRKKNDLFRQKNLVTKKTYYDPEPDPFAYNPNYNSILPRSPCYKISSPIKTTSKKKDEGEISEKFLSPQFSLKITDSKKSIINNNPLIKSYNTPLKKGNVSSIGNSNSTSIEVNKTLPSISLRKNKIKTINKKIKIVDKNNHAFRFNNYISRKNLLNININPKLTYIEPHDYDKTKNNAVDFKKMVNRKEEYFVNIPSLSVPSASFYHPKYNYLETQPIPILFTPQDIVNENKKSNKFKLHKLWTSYLVGTYYSLVDNDKL